MSSIASENIQTLRGNVNSFVDSCRLEQPFKFASSVNGTETLYGSCFAVMIKHYVGVLDELSEGEKQEWASYLNSWQDKTTGRFLGAEIKEDQLTSKTHDWEHITMHLTVHVLPALALLGAEPEHPLSFAHSFLDQDFLQDWLDNRDWRDAWLEGNNLLFVLQLLIHLRDVEHISAAQGSLDLCFDWLDSTVDPKTGLWGTNGYCSKFVAMCGGYHQLLAYYFEERPIQYPERLVDTTLRLQHADGGFSPGGGGGACEDVDAVDILVNLYKRQNYKCAHIRKALRRAAKNILKAQIPGSGFVYKKDQPFIHMGIRATATSSNQAGMFATWFRIHTLALISEVLTDEPLGGFDWKFNTVCSMGWHRTWEKSEHQIFSNQRYAEWFVFSFGRYFVSFIKENMTSIIKNTIYTALKLVIGVLNKLIICRAFNKVSHVAAVEFIMKFITPVVQQSIPEKALKFLFELENRLYILEGTASVRYGNGVHTKHRHINYHQFFINNLTVGDNVLDIGSGIGLLAYDMVRHVPDVKVTGIELNELNVKFASENYRHPNLRFIHGDALTDLPDEKFDVIVLSNVLEHLECRVDFLKKVIVLTCPRQLIIRVPLFERDWRVPLKKELGVEYRLDSTHCIEYLQEEFFSELSCAGLQQKHVEIRWGEIWSVVEPL